MKNKVFIDTVIRFFELSLARGEYFPIWGVCFGFELLLSIIGGFTRFKKYPAQGYYPLRLTPESGRSRMFGSFTNQYLYHLEYNNSTAQNHDFGISPQDFMENPHLRRFYTILATSRDNNGRDYVAAIEGKYYPVYGVQWHPERQKNCGPFADFFIGELKKNGHKCRRFFPSMLTTMKPHKCIQYPEHKERLCYFF
jgi:gamma-glutamyl hydrolase